MRRPNDTRRMSSSSFPASPLVPVVADASVIINLNATGGAAAIDRQAEPAGMSGSIRTPGGEIYHAPGDT